MIKLLKKALCFILSSAISLSAFAVLRISASRPENIPYSVDFSNSQSDYNITVPPSQILKHLYSDTDNDAELEYLDTYFQTAFIYSPEISPENVTIEIDGTILKVSATEKVYSASNGAEVVWQPVSATYENSSDMPLSNSGSEYTCDFEIGTQTDVCVKYSCTITLPNEYVEELSNFAYTEATEGAKIASENASALSSYLSALKAYEKYLADLTEYENSVDAYNEYIEKSKIYEESFAKYNAYLTSLAKYTQDLEAYDKYRADYELYLAAKKEYEDAYDANQAEYEQYRIYLENLSKIRASSAYMESLFVKPTNGVGPLFNALQNKELVSMIEKYDDELVNFYGVKRDDITTMRSVSDELNELLHGYKEAREISEEHAFAYYKENYWKITEKFQFLYDKMRSIITPTIYVHMCAWIETEYSSDTEMATYKKWRIRNVLCHIYLICRGLDDTVSAENTWDFFLENGKEYKYHFSDLLSQNVILADTDSACPDKIEWWSGEIPGNDLPKIPTAPTEVIKPVSPMPVSEPTKPDTVSAPVAKPDTVTYPGAHPKVENYELVIRTEQYFGGSIPNQRTVTSDRNVVFYQAVTRAFSTDGTKIDAYYSYDGRLLSINAQPTQALRDETTEYTYTFIEWKSVFSNGDTLYFPVYHSQKRKYIAIFSLPDGTVLDTLEYEYGEIPQYRLTEPQKNSTNTHVYEFDGWYPSPTPISRDTEYVAQFAEIQRFYTVKWDILGDIKQASLTYGATLAMPSVRHISYIDGVCYEFIGWDKAPATLTQDITYTAKFKKTSLITVSPETEASPAIYDTGTNLVVTLKSSSADISGLLEYAKKLSREITVVTDSFTLRLDLDAVSSLALYRAKTLSLLSNEDGVGYVFNDASENKVLFSGTAQMSIHHSFTDTVGIFVYRNGNNIISCTQNSGTAEFSANPSSYYKIACYRSLEVEAGENGAVFTDKNFYRHGEEVALKILPNSEYIANKITITDGTGSTTDITGQTSFIMPDANIKLSVEFAQKQYSVTFICDGEIFEVQSYLLGEKIIEPNIPLSFEKDGFLYSFIGWSEPLTIVTSDKTFTAKYASVKIEEIQSSETPKAVTTVVFTQLIPAILIVAAVAGGITFTVIFTKKKRKSDKTEALQTEAQENKNEQ